jgi:class 3 adenylate cyclase/uncharacterized membrane protein affecting hemolysin expression
VRISITVKYSLLVLVAILGTAGLVYAFLLDLLRDEIHRQLLARGESLTRQLAYSMGPLILSKDEAKAAAMVNNALKDADIMEVLVMDADGLALAKAGPGARDLVSPAWLVPELLACQGRVEDEEADRLAFLEPSTFGGVRLGCVVVRISRRPIQQAVAEVSNRVLMVTAIVSLGMILATFLMLRRNLRPLAKVIDGTRRIAEGDFSTRLKVRGRDEIGELAMAFNGMAARTELFFRYLDRSIAERLVRDESLARPGGRIKAVSVVFGDMRRFTALSNTRPPSEVVWILNTYFDLLFQVVHHHGGVVDKTMGDAIMAFFEAEGAENSRHAQRAALSAVSMRAAVWVLGEALREAHKIGIPLLVEPCEFGFAVATGRLIVGNIGSEKHMNYTVCGPSVNLAARLQEDTQLGEVIVDRFTAMDAEHLVQLQALAPVQPKGFSAHERVTPFLVMGLAPQELARLRPLLKRLFHPGFIRRQLLPGQVNGKPLPEAAAQSYLEQIRALCEAAIERNPPRFLTTDSPLLATAPSASRPPQT